MDNFARQAAQVQSRINRAMQPGSSAGAVPRDNTAQIQEKRLRDLQRAQEKEKKFWDSFETYGRKSKTKREEKDTNAADRDAQKQREAADRQIAQWKKQAEAEEARDKKLAEREKEKRGKDNSKAVDKYLKEQEAAQREGTEKAKLAQERLRDDLDKSADGVLKLVRGFVLLGSTGESDTKKILDNLLAVQGTIDSIRGGIDTFRSISGVVNGLREARVATKAAEAAKAATTASGVATTGATAAEATSAAATAGTAITRGAVTTAMRHPAGIIIAGTAAALALAADQAFNGGRVTTGLTKKLAGGLESALYNATKLAIAARVATMSEPEKLQYQRETRFQPWDVSAGFKKPGEEDRGFFGRLSAGWGAFRGAVATRNNTEILAEKTQKQIDQRRQADERSLLEFSNRQLEVGFERSSAFRDIERRNTAPVTRIRTAPNGRFLSETEQQQAQSARALESEKRANEQRLEFARQQLQEQQTRYGEERQRLETRTGTPFEGGRIPIGADDKGNRYEAALAIQRKIDELQGEILEREKEGLEVAKQQLDLAKERYHYAQEEANAAKEKLNQRIEASQGVEERIGEMSPQAIAHAVQARQRAERGEQLSKEDRDILRQVGDERSSELAKQDARRRARQYLGQYDQQGLIGNVERQKEAAAQTEAGTKSARRDERNTQRRQAQQEAEEAQRRVAETAPAPAAAAGAVVPPGAPPTVVPPSFSPPAPTGAAPAGGAPQVVVHRFVVEGSYEVNGAVDVRDDIQLAEQTGVELEKKFDGLEARILKAVRKMLENAMRQVNTQHRVNAGG